MSRSNRETHRLEEKIAGALADGLLVGIVGAVPGDDDHIGVEILFDAIRQLEAVHPRQRDIGNHDIDAFAVQDIQGFFRTAGRQCLISRHADEFMHRIANTGVIIHNQNAGIFHSTRFPWYWLVWVSSAARACGLTG